MNSESTSNDMSTIKQDTNSPEPIDTIQKVRTAFKKKGKRKKQIETRIIPPKDSLLERICKDLNVSQPPKEITSAHQFSPGTVTQLKYFAKFHTGTHSLTNALNILGIDVAWEPLKREFKTHRYYGQGDSRQSYGVPTKKIVLNHIHNYIKSQNRSEVYLTPADISSNIQLKIILGLYSLKINGTKSIHPALEKLNIEYRDGRLNFETATRAMQQLFTLDNCVDAYENRGSLRGLLAQHLNENTPVGKVLRQLKRIKIKEDNHDNSKPRKYISSRQREEYKKLTLDAVLNAIHPEIQLSYDLPLRTLIDQYALPEKVIIRELYEKFHAGKNYSKKTLIHGTEQDRRLASAIEFYAKTHKLKHFSIAVTKLKEKAGIIGENSQQSKSSSTIVAEIVQNQVRLLLEIAAMYDPNGEILGRQFTKTFGSAIQRVWFADHGVTTNPMLALNEANPGKVAYADGRIKTETRDVLIEVKNGYSLDPQTLFPVLKKYDRFHTWTNNSAKLNSLDSVDDNSKRVRRKVAILNMPSQAHAQIEVDLRKIGWYSINTDQFANMYTRALNLLEEKRPNFFAQAPFPIAGAQRLVQLHKLVQEQTHVLSRGGLAHAAKWMRNMLYENTVQGLLHGVQYEPTVFSPMVRTFRGKDLHPAYTKVDWTKAKDWFALDIEAMGVTTTSPIVAISLAYTQNEEAYCDVYFARDPLEEGQILATVQGRVQGKNVTTFNGKSYDIRVIDERCSAFNIAPFNFQNHIDIYRDKKGFSDFARLNGFVGRKLTKLESTCLGITRENDLPGKHVSAVYESYLRNHGHDKIKDLILHNGFDGCSTLAGLVHYFNSFADVKTQLQPQYSHLTTI